MLVRVRSGAPSIILGDRVIYFTKDLDEMLEKVFLTMPIIYYYTPPNNIDLKILIEEVRKQSIEAMQLFYD